jgi:(1->4)-alpha-D-glucan 1-alpha-D-glucosylmutase
LNGEPGKLESFQALDRLLARQRFRLCWWKNANEEINYRRFFDINDLIALRQENPAVFTHTHARVLEMAAAGVLDGVRIDHVDGLAAPGTYLRRLRGRLGQGAPILVEKILGPEEALAADWPVQGTTGYDFAFWLNALFVQRENAARFSAVYESFTGRREPFEAVVYRAKRDILATRLAGDRANLVRRLQAMAAEKCFAGHLTFNRLEAALTELLACLPVYRTYFGETGPRPDDRDVLEAAAARAANRRPHLQTEIDFIRDLLCTEPTCRRSPQADAPDDARRRAVRSFQQLSAALMAKGCEDTAFYRHHRLLSLNEVGGEPGRFGCGLAQFHAVIARRAAAWPDALNSTATHDSKRGEDVRARLNVLSEMPASWAKRLAHWHDLTRSLRPRVGGTAVPDRHTAYLLFQTLIGAWPVGEGADTAFVERIRDYMVKAVREAGEATSWIDPREDFEAALTAFIDRILTPSPGNRFLTDFAPFCRKIAFYGRFNALSQCLIKITAPGIPDFFQGTELWQLALVDPDNRRPVAYDARQRLLDELGRSREEPRSLAASLLQTAADGRIKLFLIARSLQARRQQGALFRSGDYLPLHALGTFRRHVVAFARKLSGRWVLVVVPRFLSTLVKEDQLPLGRDAWQDTVVALPATAPRTWRNVFTQEKMRSTTDLAVADTLAHFPVALLASEVVP